MREALARDAAAPEAPGRWKGLAGALAQHSLAHGGPTAAAELLGKEVQGHEELAPAAGSLAVSSL